MDVDTGTRSGFDTRQYTKKATDFELHDYWDEGEILDGRDKWPVCVTLNLVCTLVSDGDIILMETIAATNTLSRRYPLKRRHLHRFDSFSCSRLRLHLHLMYKECAYWEAESLI